MCFLRKSSRDCLAPCLHALNYSCNFGISSTSRSNNSSSTHALHALKSVLSAPPTLSFSSLNLLSNLPVKNDISHGTFDEEF